MLPTGSPGWGLSRAGHWLRTGLPRMRDAQGRVVDESAGLAAAIEERTGTAAPVAMASCRPTSSGPRCVTKRRRNRCRWHCGKRSSAPSAGIGVRIPTFMRSVPEVRVARHFCGHCVARSARRSHPEQAQLHVIDLRRQLVGAVSQEHIGSYSVTISAAKEAMAELIGLLQARTPPGRPGQRCCGIGSGMVLSCSW